MPKIAVEKFDKEYAYNICHNYGKEWKCTDYTLYSCTYINMSTLGVQDQHGCSYRHFSIENLNATLLGIHFNRKSIDEAMKNSRGR